eukprot:1157747-Pelagomonas_calceolata.AAC.4
MKCCARWDVEGKAKAAVSSGMQCCTHWNAKGKDKVAVGIGIQNCVPKGMRCCERWNTKGKAQGCCGHGWPRRLQASLQRHSCTSSSAFLPYNRPCRGAVWAPGNVCKRCKSERMSAPKTI